MNENFETTADGFEMFHNQFAKCINCGVEIPFDERKVDEPCPSCKMTGEEYHWIRNGIGYD